MANDDDGQGIFSALDLDKAELEDMTKALRKVERENRSLFEDIRHLRDRLTDEKANQSDVYYYLHKRLDDNYDVISTLERQLVVEATDREKAEMEYGIQIEDLEHRMDEELVPLKEKLIALEGQVNSMHEAAENKRESDAKRARLEKVIEVTSSIIESDLNVEQRMKLQEKQRVKREIEEQIEQLSIELSSKKEAELADKTLRTAENNQKLHALLHSKAKQAERMMIINQGLAFENSRIRNDVDLVKVSEAALGKRVRVYHDLLIDLKAQLEQADSVDSDMNEGQLADLEESLSGWSIKSSTTGGAMGISWAGQDAMSLASDTNLGFQDVWTDEACHGLVYESVDELRVAIDSLRHLHEELQGEARHLTACADEENAAGAASERDDDPLVAILLDVAEKWVSRSKSNVEDRENGIDKAKKVSLVSRGGLRRHYTTESNSRGESRGRHRGTVDRLERTVDDRRNNRSSLEIPETKMGLMIRRGMTHERSSFAACMADSGPLAKETANPVLRRELFYNLVGAFQDYQTKSRPANKTAAENRVKRDPKSCVDDPLVKTMVTDGRRVHGTGESLAHNSRGNQNTMAGRAHAGGDWGGASMSDLSSVSVCTLGELGAMERRNASTQTLAKHFPEKFAAVRAARRLVITNTFLTTNSTLSASTSRSGGLRTLPTDNHLNRQRLRRAETNENVRVPYLLKLHPQSQEHCVTMKLR